MSKIKVDSACYQKIEEMLNSGATTGECIKYVMDKYPNVTYNNAQKRVARVRTKLGITPVVRKAVQDDDTIVVNKNGIVEQEMRYDGKKDETTFVGLVEIRPGDRVSKEFILDKYGLCSREWEIVGFKLNEWQAQKKGGDTLNLKQFTLNVRPKRPSEYSAEEEAEIFKEVIEKVSKKFNIKNIEKFMRVKRTRDGVTLVVVAPDVHWGLLAWDRETGENSDLNIQAEEFRHAMREIITKITLMNIPIKEIKFVSLGDLLHVDNDKQETTRGTFQQVDGRFPKIIETATELLAEAIMMCANIAPTEYIYIPGNHDRNTGWHLAYSMSMLFKDWKNVTIDYEPNPHKVRRIGDVAVGFTHGDASPKNIDWLMHQLTVGMSDIYLRYLITGHLHNASLKSCADGSTIREGVDSFCHSGKWEHEMGYPRTPLLYLKAFLFDGTATPPDTIIGKSR